MKRYILPKAESVTMSMSAAEKLIELGDGKAALLYIYILKNGGGFSETEAASCLHWEAEAISAALSRLEKAGLVALDSKNEKKSGRPEPAEEMPEYSAADVRLAVQRGGDFGSLVREVQNTLGRVLSSDDLMKLLGMYESLGLPPEVIMQLVTHCLCTYRKKYGPGRVPTMRYIEKNAYVWEREGIFSIESAEAFIKEADRRDAICDEIIAVLQIRGRALTASEQRFVDSWISMGFGADAVEIGYDRTVLNTGKLSWKYLDSIMNNWHARGLKTAADIEKGDAKRIAGAGNDSPKSISSRSLEDGPSEEEVARMRKMLTNIKNS